MLIGFQARAVQFLRWTEKYTKTDMVYLVTTGFWVNLNFITFSILSLLLSIAFANLLPPEVYGLYQYLLSLSALIGAIMLAGMSTAVTQAVSRGYEGALVASVRTQLRWAVVPGLLSLAGAGYYFLHGNFEVGSGLVCIAFLTPLVNSFSTYSAFLNGKKEFKRAFYFSNIVSISYYSSIFLTVLFLKTAPLLILVNLTSNTLATFYVYRKTLALYKPNHSVDPGTIPYGKHLSIMSAFGTVLTQLDSLLVFHFLGPVQLAVYSFASMIPERAGGLFAFIGVASLPKFANQSQESIQKNLISKTTRVAIAGILMAGIYALIAPFLFDLVFPRYMSAVPYTQIYAFIIALMAMMTLVNTALIAKELKRELYIVSFLNPILLITLQIPLLLLYGIMGMLIARMLSDTVIIIVSLILFFRSAKNVSKQRV